MVTALVLLWLRSSVAYHHRGARARLNIRVSPLDHISCGDLFTSLRRGRGLAEVKLRVRLGWGFTHRADPIRDALRGALNELTALERWTFDMTTRIRLTCTEDAGFTFIATVPFAGVRLTNTLDTNLSVSTDEAATARAST